MHDVNFKKHEVIAMKLSDFNPEGNLGRSTAERVCEIIRQAIIARVFEQGERLVEAKIAQDLNVSITPIRHAFATLANQGLLSIFPYKGTYVTIITEEFMNDLEFIRQEIEGLAAKRAFDNIKSEDATTLLNMCKLSDYYFQSGNLYQAIHHDCIFHEFFISKANSPLLMEMWTLIRSRIEYVQAYTKGQFQPDDYLQVRHGAMIKAVEEQNKEAFLRALESHLASTTTIISFPKTADALYNK